MVGLKWFFTFAGGAVVVAVMGAVPVYTFRVAVGG